MKNFKLKSILLGLITLTMLIVLMASCEKESIQPIEEKLSLEEEAPITEQTNDIQLRTFNKTCFVELCYSSYLGRCADQAGINYWLSVLGNASLNKIATVAIGFITSQEARSKWENNYALFLAASGLSRSDIKKSIYIAYRGLLLRQPDVGGGIYWTDMQQSDGLRAAVKGIASSPEFFNRLSNIQAECNAYNANCP